MSAFCKGCDNILDISRNQPKKESLEDYTPADVSSSENNLNYDDIVDQIENGEKISDRDILKIDFIILQRNKKFQSKSTKIKQKIRRQIDELIDQKDSSDSNVKAFHVCNNCAYSEQIKSKQLIISRLSDTRTSTDMDIDVKHQNKLFSNILPFTREYNCPNKNCSTHSGDSKEAKFFRTRGTTHTWYLCVKCHEAWRIS